MTVSSVPQLRAVAHVRGVDRLLEMARLRWIGGLTLALFVVAAAGTFFLLHDGGGGVAPPVIRQAGGQGSAQIADAGIRDRFVRFRDLVRGFPRGWQLPGDVRARSRFVGRLNGAKIFAAPTRDGYWEMFNVSKGGWAGGRPWRTGWPADRLSGPYLVGGAGHSTDSGIYLDLGGSTIVAPGAKLFVVYADGSRERLKVIWVSKPIGAGFYYSVVPRSHRSRARRAMALELTRHRQVVARQVLAFPRRWRMPNDRRRTEVMG